MTMRMLSSQASLLHQLQKKVESTEQTNMCVTSVIFRQKCKVDLLIISPHYTVIASSNEIFVNIISILVTDYLSIKGHIFTLNIIVICVGTEPNFLTK